jgi:hypothetical protein
MQSLVWLTLVGVLLIASAIAVTRARMSLRRRVEDREPAEIMVSVDSRLAGHEPLAPNDSASRGTGHDEMDEAILAVLRAEPNVYTKTALAKHVGCGYSTALKRVSALQVDGHVVPNVRGAKLALAPMADKTTTPGGGRHA